MVIMAIVYCLLCVSSCAENGTYILSLILHNSNNMRCSYYPNSRNEEREPQQKLCIAEVMQLTEGHTALCNEARIQTFVCETT